VPRGEWGNVFEKREEGGVRPFKGASSFSKEVGRGGKRGRRLGSTARDCEFVKKSVMVE